ncbi:unnamed protein product [Cylindrotheca closterium]|uniref:Uncharacterized protein n=1 Tax=Cylindrotheca closterium TaxID=2856 RepID=A0AAD2FEP4_9STRA|nr:unnamed protein product [Cylindrotheca closterium]
MTMIYLSRASLLLHFYILLSLFSVNHGFVLSPTRPSASSVGQEYHRHHDYNEVIVLSASTSLSAVHKKSFDSRNQSNNNNNNNNDENSGMRKRIIHRLRIRRNTKTTRTSKATTPPLSPPSGPATQYIPSGMTLEEYNQLKAKEIAAESNKNYGAWGPRFAPSDRPEGDWMVLPQQLWTQGAVDGLKVTAAQQSGKESNINRLLQRIYQQVPALILSTVVLDSVVTAVTLYRTATVDWRQMVWIACRVPLAMLLPAKVKQVVLVNFTRIHAVKALAVLMIAPLLDRYFLIPVNRYRLWSKRRTVALSTIGSLGILSMWALFLGTLKRVGLL